MRPCCTAEARQVVFFGWFRSFSFVCTSSRALVFSLRSQSWSSLLFPDSDKTRCWWCWSRKWINTDLPLKSRTDLEFTSRIFTHKDNNELKCVHPQPEVETFTKPRRQMGHKIRPWQRDTIPPALYRDSKHPQLMFEERKQSCCLY